MRIQNKIKRLRKQNKRLDEIQNISRFRGFVERRILLSHTGGGGGGGDRGKGQRAEVEAEGRGRRRRQRRSLSSPRCRTSSKNGITTEK